ncbi:post-GPI attachment to proteins factor 2-like isoform X2 [Littorina saxatilis]|uniref:CWH43-like N-terminal domain-containing protein n=1 Tax=Littorina saxatilis TaxID=31220 RepID=A0AAN9B193_9CAEN
MGGHKPIQDRPVHFAITVPTMIKITCSLPLIATLFCVVWSLMFDFDASTRTHCKVHNWLPTISAVIGGFTPQRYVWRICIALHAPQRLMVAIGYYSYHTSVHVGMRNELYKAVAAVNSLLHLIEVLSLVFLSMISSSENGKMHEFLFISFMVTALTYMLLTIILMRWGRCGHGRIPSLQEATSLRYKTILFLFNLSVFAVAVYFFYRHNAYCEPGVYTAFAFFEYLTVVSNIGFHSLIIMDFHNTGVLMVDLNSQDDVAVGRHHGSESLRSQRKDGYNDCPKGM